MLVRNPSLGGCGCGSSVGAVAPPKDGTPYVVGLLALCGVLYWALKAELREPTKA